MRRIIAAAVFILAFSLPAWAQTTINFAWDWSSPDPSVFEFRVGTAAGGPYGQSFDVAGGLKIYSFVTSTPGSYFAVVRACNVGQPATLRTCGGNSNEVAFVIPAAPTGTPGNNRITGAQVAMQIQIPEGKEASIKIAFAQGP